MTKQPTSATPMSVFHNPTAKPIAFRLGSTPGIPPDEYVIGPGEEFQGFFNYQRFYKRHGLELGPNPAKAKAAKPKDDDVASAGVPPRGR